MARPLLLPSAAMICTIGLGSIACDKDEPAAKPSADAPPAEGAKADGTEPGAFEKYQRRSKGSEAMVQTAKMSDAATAFAMEEQLGADGTVVRRCPSDGRAEGSTELTPPLSVNCNDGPKGACIPVEGEPKNPGEYSMKLWEGQVWQELNFQMSEGHFFHYKFNWKTEADGECMFTAQAFGDLDDDQVMSTFERHSLAGLSIEQELE